MYKDSEPIRSLHSVKKHVANVYESEVCLQTKKFPKISRFFPRNSPKHHNYQKYQYLYDNSSEISETSDKLWKNMCLRPQCSNLIGSESLYIPPTERYVSLRLRVQNGISRLISALCVNCLISIPEYSRIIDYSIIWLSTCVTVFNTC